ncbi:hypothetical protein AVEN_233663-1 [Araneus ventricosus]|uniref:Uncharacterized protein n=1 Tax=Araneus ventricosus TaxID=182803 RepID=A0A4Y2GJ91_ARAVE|nr:hypothetical protein AVEN_233663-1 [Araneus ventricosus]
MPDNDQMSPYTVVGEVNGFKMLILRDTGTTLDIVSRKRRPEMLTEVDDETLDFISQVNCQESEFKDFSTKSESDISKEFLEDADFGSEPEQENQTAESLATENIVRKIEENDSRQVKTLDKSDPFNEEGDFSQNCCCEYKSCDSTTLENHIFNAEMRIKKDSEDKNAEGNESKCKAMDTSETLENKNGVTNDCC